MAICMCFCWGSFWNSLTIQNDLHGVQGWVHVKWLTFSILACFGCGVMSLLRSGGCDMPMLLNEIIKKYLFHYRKAYLQYINHWRWLHLLFDLLIVCYSTFLKHISISDLCLIMFVSKLAIKWPEFDQNHCANSTKTSFTLVKPVCTQALFSFWFLVMSWIIFGKIALLTRANRTWRYHIARWYIWPLAHIGI